jgi:hypothetical protein
MDEKDKNIEHKPVDLDDAATIEKDEPIDEAPAEKNSNDKKEQSIAPQKQDGKLLFFEIATVILLIILTVFITRDILIKRNLIDTFNSQGNIGYPHRF